MKLFKYTIVQFLVLTLPNIVWAQTGPAPGSGGVTGPAPSQSGGGSAKLENPLGANTDLVALLHAILNALVILAVPVIVFFIIYAGFQFVTAQGNDSKLTSAKNALLYAVIGGVIILGAELIFQVIAGTIQSI